MGLGFTCLLTIGYIPQLSEFADRGMQSAVDILTIFGNGNPIEGIVAIGLTYSLVNMLFEAFASHRYHKW
ncbi:MAG: hypothetical protein SWY16_02820 [Cyanobacteriota bacterium]|nr:hypothetical protein [Cyanobacteriota bacterium]